ncbi:unnamed protein product [Callosobruchus maculatus]|uniref:Uncharacterized protein n=1 Tax=Callosobruchus maculatus TaxID=64391 RepID=A0A653DF95_CALMS|nr:unnamed protein product [Callosobruchus maculatus]
MIHRTVYCKKSAENLIQMRIALKRKLYCNLK